MKKVFAFLFVLAISGCVTIYQSSGFRDGYSDTQLAPDVFRIFLPDFTVDYSTGETLYVVAERLSDASSNTITLTDNGDGTYTGNMPASAGLGQYRCSFYKQLGASPDTDTDILLYFETRIR